MSYSESFEQIRFHTVEATKQLVKSGLWKKDKTDEYKIKICKRFLDQLSEIYSIEPPKFNFLHAQHLYDQTGGGVYHSTQKQISLYNKFSLVTLLHEFRHHMQNEVYGLEIYKNDVEEDARGWSVSLFKMATPKAYKNAVEKGLLHFS